jgi:hypothetical protein
VIARVLLAAAAALLGPLAAAAPAADWERYPMPPPPGGGLSSPAGYPGDLSFWAPNRGLMAVGGNNAVPEGLYSWNGAEWRQLAIVCGGGTTARIAWAGPREFWTIARPSRPRQGVGVALCHFKDGAVVGSFSTPPGADDAYQRMQAAACLAPDNCWFAGIGAQDASGQRVGAFHLHWDGTALRTVYNPQGRAVSDLLAHRGTLFESTHIGRMPDNADAPDLRVPEDPPRLLHRIVGQRFENDPFVPAPMPGVPADGSELLALDGAGDVAWVVGGGTNSGPSRPWNRTPLAARLEQGAWRELPIAGAGLATDDVFADVAAVPGTRTAWAAVRSITQPEGSNSDRTAVALIGEDGATEVEELVRRGDPRRGAAVRVECPAADDCWLATAQGYLFRRSDAAPYQRDTDPAFQGPITERPNEAAEQSIPDTPPEDDSRLHAPPLEIIPPPPPPQRMICDPVRSPIANVRKPKVRKGRRLVVRFRLRRTAKVRLVAYHRKRVVARTKLKRLRKGRRSLAVRVSRKRWPTRLRFVVRDIKRPQPSCRPGAAAPDDVVTSGPGR